MAGGVSTGSAERCNLVDMGARAVESKRRQALPPPP